MRRIKNPSLYGFTLLEVLVSVAILGLGLTAILSAQAGAFESAAHARHISVASGLLRCKMNEVEEHLFKEGFQDTDETGYGPCCEGDETPNMKCVWRADRPVFPDGQFGNLDLSSALNFGGGSSGSPSPGGGGLGALGMLSSLGAPGGGPSPLGTASNMTDVAKMLSDANAQAMNPNATGASSLPLDGTLPQGAWASTSGGFPMSSSSSGMSSGGLGGPGDTGSASGMGGLASLAMSIVYPSLKLLFEASTRRITASLTFREGKREYTIDVVEWFSVPQKGLAATDDSGVSSVAAPASSAPPQQRKQ
jgi:general secretion pathway protein I